MFITLLIVTFFIAVLTSFVVALIFKKTIQNILNRIISEDLGNAWSKYIVFAIYVVGISGGVRIWELERYITPLRNEITLSLTSDRWVLEVYHTIIGTLQSLAWMLLIFFLVALVAYVIVRGFELRRSKEQN